MALSEESWPNLHIGDKFKEYKGDTGELASVDNALNVSIALETDNLCDSKDTCILANSVNVREKGNITHILMANKFSSLHKLYTVTGYVSKLYRVTGYVIKLYRVTGYLIKLYRVIGYVIKLYSYRLRH